VEEGEESRLSARTRSGGMGRREDGDGVEEVRGGVGRKEEMEFMIEGPQTFISAFGRTNKISKSLFSGWVGGGERVMRVVQAEVRPCFCSER